MLNDRNYLEKKHLQSGKLEARKKINNVSLTISNFPKIVKKHLGHLPQDDYPVLNAFLFVSTWLNFALNQSEIRM
jgi:hypothetical protein